MICENGKIGKARTFILKEYMSRKYLRWILLLSAATYALNAQVDGSQQVIFKEIYSAAERAYGMNQELLNGVLLESKNQDALGHPYFQDFYTNQGSVTYRGRRYANLNLRYDIFDQQLLLIYLHDGVEYQLWLHKEFITEFSVENKRFIYETLGAVKEPKFYQVIGEGHPVKVLYYWEKRLTKVNAGNSERTMFEERRESYILVDNELVGFKGNRSFAGRLPMSFKKSIKEYLRKNATKVKRASDDEMEHLVEYINTLSPGGNK
jgi:hypothetical protein